MNIVIKYLEKPTTPDEIAVKRIFENSVAAVANRNALVFKKYSLPHATFAIINCDGVKEYLNLHEFITRMNELYAKIISISYLDVLVRIKNKEQAVVTAHCEARIISNLWPSPFGREFIYSRPKNEWLLEKLNYLD